MPSDVGAPGTGGGRRWELTPAALASLLAFLGPEEEAAARAYERIRRRLLKIFEWRGCDRPEELTDETFDRVARKLAEGLEVEADDPLRYFCGVAYRVFKEVLREEQKGRSALAEIRRLPPPAAADPEAERRLGCLDACLGEVEPAQRDLVLRYHAGDGRERIDDRHALAEELDVPLNALRIRVHRLRVKLEACVRACLSAK